MKNSKQIAEAVLKERDKAQEKNKARNRRIKRVSSCMSVAFVFLTVVLGAKHFDSSQFQVLTFEPLLDEQLPSHSLGLQLVHKLPLYILFQLID